MQQSPSSSSHQRHSAKRIKKRRRRRRKEEQSKIWAACLILSSFALLFTLWIFTMMYYILPMMMFENNNDANIDGGGRLVSSSSSVQSALFHSERQPSINITTINHQKQTPQQSKLLSRNPNIIITSSTRGNLGPPTVLNQNPPGKDWIKDRWQAASDMHGTAIKGEHWVLMDFSQFLLTEDRDDVGGKDGNRGGGGRRGIQMTKIVLDWETAFATDYRIEGRMDPPSASSLQQDEWCVLYDGGSGGGGHPNNENDKRHEKELQYGIQFHEAEYGQSPGVKQKLPLHIIHTIEWTASSSSLTLKNKNEQSNSESHLRGGGIGGSCQTTTAFRYLRIFIRKPARGWGCSLWEVDVYGTIV